MGKLHNGFLFFIVDQRADERTRLALEFDDSISKFTVKGRGPIVIESEQVAEKILKKGFMLNEYSADVPDGLFNPRGVPLEDRILDLLFSLDKLVTVLLFHC